MHLVMLLIALLWAWIFRLPWQPSSSNWHHRWLQTLFFFLFPPLLLLDTSLAVLYMGHSGKMLGLQATWFSCFLAGIFITFAILKLLQLTYHLGEVKKQINTYSEEFIFSQEVRMLATTLPYSAQIGFWRCQLVVSQGLLDTLDAPHLEAVLAHEQAHCHYRDTFWFFWLGWLRSLTSYLPHTELLWQELLLLRELRADRRAAQEIDPLLLAESLLAVAKAPLMYTESFSAPLSCAVPSNRLGERIEALLGETESFSTFPWWTYAAIVLPFLPFLTVPFHY